MVAAWLGAIAHVLWARHPRRAARLLIALGSAACAGIGLAFRPDVTFLDSEHVFAYAIGVALADPGLRRRLTLSTRRLVAVTASVLVASRGA